jgi:hypothetical protein
MKKPTQPRSNKPPKRPNPTGAIAVGTEPCVCGHSPEEHGRDPEYPGSTACQADGPAGEDAPGDGCDCIAYEADPEKPQ